jgi:hypothetical protein
MKWLFILALVLGIPASALILHDQLCRTALEKVAEKEAPYPGDAWDKLKFLSYNEPTKYKLTYTEPLLWRYRVLRYAMAMGNYKLIIEETGRAIDMHKESPLEKDELMMKLCWMRAKAYDLTNEKWSEAAAAYRYYLETWPESPLVDQAKSRANEIDSIHR